MSEECKKHRIQAPIVAPSACASCALEKVRGERYEFAVENERLRAELAAIKAGQGEAVGDWCIDTSAGREILVYKECSVIEGDDARYVLGLILAESRAQQPSTGVAGEAVARNLPEKWEVDCPACIRRSRRAAGRSVGLTTPRIMSWANFAPCSHDRR